MKIYWRRLGGWATDLKSKYWQDPFFRSEFNVILLQFLFTAVLLFLVAFSFNYLYKDVSNIIISGIRDSINQGSDITAQDILSSVNSIKNQKFYGFFILTTLITLGFSYLIAKITLTPARNALQSQKRFISDIAHELRTPLSVIKTNSEVALMSDSIEPSVRRTLKSIIEELDRTSEIINNLLSFSNLVRPERVNFSQVDLGPLVDSSISKLKALAESKQLDISVQKITPHNVWGNATALEQIIVNLLKNAINYTPSGGHVSIRIEPDYRGSVILTVQDSGVGISRQDLIHIFEPFYRAERSRNRQSGSSGLGLTIVSELIKLHSGRITIKSFPNRGTTATVFLPYSKDEEISPDKKGNLNEVSIDFVHHKA